jgi:Photosynthesis system II assembly factor YCF48
MNPRDNEREFGAMVRRGLASGPSAAESDHLDAEVLAAYFERTLSAEEIRACDLHVSNCARCRGELAALARAEPESDEVSGSRPFAWLWDWRLLVPVTAALTIFIAWITVRRPFESRNDRVAAPIVAQNQQPAAAPQLPPPSSEMVEVSPAPSENANKSGHAAAPQSKSADSLGQVDGRPNAAGNRPGGGTQAPRAPRAERREFKKEKDRGASDSSAGGAGAGNGQATGGGYDRETQTPRAAAAVPPAAPAPSASNETVEVTSGQASEPAEADQSGAAPSSSPNGSTANGATGKNVTAPKNATAPRGGVRGAGVAGAAGGIAAQKSAAPPVAETVTSRFKQDESTPIVILTPDANILWRVAGAHEIQLSRDIGVTWTPQLTETDVRLVTGSAPSSKICWVVGRRGTILRTVDGENWELVKSPTELDLTSVTAEDADAAAITASDGKVYATKNGGAKWKRVKKPH